MSKQQRVVDMYKEFPYMTTAELADMIGCTKRTVRYALEGMRRMDTTHANILLFDLETAPLEVYSWGIWKQMINPGMIIKEWSLLSWSAKWLFESDIMGQVVKPYQAEERIDASIINDLWNLMDKADIIIAHNAVKFDVKKMNARFILNGLAPPSPYRVIDTLSVVKRMFAFTSNKLDYVNGLLSITQKMNHTGMQMWKDCVNGTNREALSALAMMLEYNKVDVVALEELYLVLRPWIKSHPNVNLYQSFDDTIPQAVRCANCGTDNVSWQGKYYTPAGRYKSFRCLECGAIGRSRYSDLSKQERKTLGLAIAN
jgi:hypothetical protein